MSEHNTTPGNALSEQHKVTPKNENEDRVFHVEQGEDMNSWQPDPVNNGSEDQPPPQLSDFDGFRITKEKDIPQPPPIVLIGEGHYASPGNISAISAAAKGGKTALTSVIIAGAISKTGNVDGFETLRVAHNPASRAVIHFDTEQSEADQQYIVNTVLKRAGYKSTPDYFRSYNIRQLSIEDYQEKTDLICELSYQQFGGVHMIIIDGGADYITSVNDEEQARLIIQYFIHLSIKYYCPVIVIVHLNPGSEKERGHFGSEIQRKCYGLLTISKDENDISTATPKIMRKAGREDMPAFGFKYSKEKGYHEQVEIPTAEMKKTAKDLKKMENVKNIAADILGGQVALKHKELYEAIMQKTGLAITQAKTMLSNMTGWGFVTKGEDKRYRLNN